MSVQGFGSRFTAQSATMLVVYEDIQLYVGFTRRSLPHGSPHRSAGFRWFSMVSGVTGGVLFFKFAPRAVSY